MKKGWGEFPIHAQIHFKDPRNKRVDINHLLKLDWTQTGLQTFGGETTKECQLIIKPNDFKSDGSTSMNTDNSPDKLGTDVKEAFVTENICNKHKRDEVLSSDQSLMNNNEKKTAEENTKRY